jgi:uncharacterized membrane protein SpoIIM required for sporulation
MGKLLGVFLTGAASVIAFNAIMGNTPAWFSYYRLYSSFLDVDPMTVFVPVVIGNIIVVTVLMFSGLTGRKWIPYLIVFWNGVPFGTLFFLMRYDVQRTTQAILPHGLIEIPAFLFTAACAVHYIERTGKDTNATDRYVVRPYFMVILPLIILGAAMEAYWSIPFNIEIFRQILY